MENCAKETCGKKCSKVKGKKNWFLTVCEGCEEIYLLVLERLVDVLVVVSIILFRVCPFQHPFSGNIKLLLFCGSVFIFDLVIVFCYFVNFLSKHFAFNWTAAKWKVKTVFFCQQTCKYFIFFFVYTIFFNNFSLKNRFKKRTLCNLLLRYSAKYTEEAKDNGIVYKLTSTDPL